MGLEATMIVYSSLLDEFNYIALITPIGLVTEIFIQPDGKLKKKLLILLLKQSVKRTLKALLV